MVSRWFPYASLGIAAYSSPSIDDRVQHLQKDEDKRKKMLKKLIFFIKTAVFCFSKKKTEQNVGTGHLLLSFILLDKVFI